MTTIEVEQQPSQVSPERQSTRRAGTAAQFVEPATQLLLVAAAALTYFAVRGLTETDVVVAAANARDLLTVEHHIGFDGEAWLQRCAIRHDGVVTAMNWVYIWGHWPVIAATLVWLHRSRHDAYRLMRNAMFVSGAIGLIVFATYPVAPPRLAGLGFVDTVTEHSSSYRLLQPPSLVNKYAAVPSLHVGWNFLVGVFVWRHTARRWLRTLALASPALMFTAVVITANHYVLDGILGITVASIGLAIATHHSGTTQPNSSSHADRDPVAHASRPRPPKRPWASPGQGGERFKPACYEETGASTSLREIPAGAHVDGLFERPEESERRVVAFVDASLLQTPSEASASPDLTGHHEESSRS